MNDKISKTYIIQSAIIYPGELAWLTWDEVKEDYVKALGIANDAAKEMSHRKFRVKEVLHRERIVHTVHASDYETQMMPE